jgi:hypothetical protein
VPTTPDDEEALTADINELARQYGRYGYRRITAQWLPMGKGRPRPQRRMAQFAQTARGTVPDRA